MTTSLTTKWDRKHLLGIEDLTANEIAIILQEAAEFKKILQLPIPKTKILQGRTIVHLFCEPSTRTRTSFELAAKRLGADTVNITAAASSFLKGESLKDTVRNIEAMRAEIFVIRHSCAGAPHQLSKWTKASIINAGDGMHEHPTQALLDVFTIQETFQQIRGLNVAIIGDIAHSRVAYSNILALKKLGANVKICGPKTLMPTKIAKLGVYVTHDIRDALDNTDVINVLRIQKERQNEAFLPSLREYSKQFGITASLLKKHAKKNLYIMHPGPINRGIELSHDVADSKHSLILQQTANGVAVRMAILSLLGQAEPSR